MLRGVFVTGTDTGVGKTVAAAALLLRYRREARPGRLRYWKPVQTGIGQDNDSETVRQLCGDSELVLDEGIRLERPVSPHLAARLAGRPIRLTDLASVAVAQPASDRWIVEGAGGVLVPLDDSRFMTDLIALVGLPAVIVSRSGLGTINHTLLTIEALRRRSLEVAGVIMMGPSDAENRTAIETYGETHVLGELPMLQPLTPAALEAWALEQLDPAGRLAKLLT